MLSPSTIAVRRRAITERLNAATRRRDINAIRQCLDELDRLICIAFGQQGR